MTQGCGFQRDLVDSDLSGFGGNELRFGQG